MLAIGTPSSYRFKRGGMRWCTHPAAVRLNVSTAALGAYDTHPRFRKQFVVIVYKCPIRGASGSGGTRRRTATHSSVEPVETPRADLRTAAASPRTSPGLDEL